MNRLFNEIPNTSPFVNNTLDEIENSIIPGYIYSQTSRIFINSC